MSEKYTPELHTPEKEYTQLKGNVETLQTLVALANTSGIEAVKEIFFK
jgi:hypothetical protein